MFVEKVNRHIIGIQLKNTDQEVIKLGFNHAWKLT